VPSVRHHNYQTDHHPEMRLGNYVYSLNEVLEGTTRTELKWRSANRKQTERGIGYATPKAELELQRLYMN